VALQDERRTLAAPEAVAVDRLVHGSPGLLRDESVPVAEVRSRLRRLLASLDS
jgi:hypothetical protein